MAKEKEAIIKQAHPDEVLSKEKSDTSMPLDSGDWVDNLKNGDLLYSAGYEKNEEGDERVMVLTLKFIEYDKKSVTDKNTRMATLKPIVEGKESENIKLPSQNLRSGYFPTKVEAVKAFEGALGHMLDVVKTTRIKLEEENSLTKKSKTKKETK